MKQPKLLLPILLFVCLSRLLSSCCDSDNRITSENGFYFQFIDDSKILKIELMGKGRTINYADSSGIRAYITLNPADTVSSFRIFYENKAGQHTSGNGIVTMKYTRKPTYRSNGCEEALVIVYDADVSSTTFTKAVLFNSSGLFGSTYVEITP